MVFDQQIPLAFCSPDYLVKSIVWVVVGIIVACGSLLGNIPFFGPIIVGALFFLALAAGFVMTLVLLGLDSADSIWDVSSTIAVEGLDSFDAISRSFSYLVRRTALAFGVLYCCGCGLWGADLSVHSVFHFSDVGVKAHKFVGWVRGCSSMRIRRRANGL